MKTIHNSFVVSLILITLTISSLAKASVPCPSQDVIQQQQFNDINESQIGILAIKTSPFYSGWHVWGVALGPMQSASKQQEIEIANDLIHKAETPMTMASQATLNPIDNKVYEVCMYPIEGEPSKTVIAALEF